MQVPELGRRLDADLLDQGRPGVPVGLERLGLAAAPVQREHALRVQPLAQRVLGHQGVELTDELVMVPRREVRVDRELGGGEPQLLEPADLGIRERLLREIRERIAAEQRERLARRARRPPGRGRARRLQDQPLEATHVHPLAVDPQLVRAPARDDLRSAPGGQRAAQPPDVVLHHLGSARRRVVSPQALDQPIRRSPCGWPRARASPAPRAASRRRSRRAGRRCWPQAARGCGCTWSSASRRARAPTNPITSAGSGSMAMPHGDRRWSTAGLSGRSTPRRDWT